MKIETKNFKGRTMKEGFAYVLFCILAQFEMICIHNVPNRELLLQKFHARLAANFSSNRVVFCIQSRLVMR